ncbi:MAG: hypothetical protein R3F20_06955 [Planctomycetota bacterium]
MLRRALAATGAPRAFVLAPEESGPPRVLASRGANTAAARTN